MSGWGRDTSKAVTGTLAVTQGSVDIVGTGTAFTTELKAGQWLVIEDVAYVINSIADATHLKLEKPYAGTTASLLSATASEKPSADKTRSFGLIYGVDATEAGITAGVAQPGWVQRKVIGTRVLFETLVAMKTAPTEETILDDAAFPEVTLVISTPPVSPSEVVGDTAEITLTATVTPTAGNTILYQWQVADAEDGEFADVGAGYTGGTTATLQFTSALAVDGKWYRCVISVLNKGSIMSAPVEFTVLRPVITIDTDPVADGALDGQTATFTVEASAVPTTTLAYQWQVADTETGTYADIAAGAPYSGETTATLTVTVSATVDGKWYRCVVSAESMGSNDAISAAAQVTLLTE
jgi:hypothetical protein